MNKEKNIRLAYLKKAGLGIVTIITVIFAVMSLDNDRVKAGVMEQLLGLKAVDGDMGGAAGQYIISQSYEALAGYSKIDDFGLSSEQLKEVAINIGNGIVKLPEDGITYYEKLGGNGRVSEQSFYTEYLKDVIRDYLLENHISYSDESLEKLAGYMAQKLPDIVGGVYDMHEIYMKQKDILSDGAYLSKSEIQRIIVESTFGELSQFPDYESSIDYVDSQVLEAKESIRDNYNEINENITLKYAEFKEDCNEKYELSKLADDELMLVIKQNKEDSDSKYYMLTEIATKNQRDMYDIASAANNYYETVLADLKYNIAEKNTELENKLAELFTISKQNLSEARMEFDEKISSNKSELDEKISSNKSELDEKISTNKSELDEKIAENKTATDEAISKNGDDIASNIIKIALNAAGIETNSSKINSNTSDIAQNTSKISENAAGIASNAEAISANAAGIASNAEAISTNAAGIASNAQAISANSTGISANAGAISANASGIATNTANIATNTSDIASLLTRMNSAESAISGLGSISSNGYSLGNGMKIFWGSEYFDADGVYVTVSRRVYFPAYYDSTNYVVFFTATNENPIHNSIYITSKSTAYFDCNMFFDNPAGGTASYDWVAIGY